MPTLRRLEYLIAISEHRNFHRAAKAAHVSQPTLSQQLRLLEDELGVVLIDRSLAGGELTPIGRDIYERARRIIGQVDDLKRAALVAQTGGEVGILRVGVSPTLGPYLLPEIVAELYSDTPGLKIHIREGIPDEQVGELTNGAIDLLLAPLPLRSAEMHTELLFEEPLRIVASVGHPLTKRRLLETADLANHGVLNLDSRHHLSRQLTIMCDALKMQLLQNYEGTSLDSLYQMAASGLGLAILPELYLKSSAGAVGGVRVLKVRGYEMSRQIALLWRKDAPYQDTCFQVAKRIRMRGSKLLRGRLSGVSAREAAREAD